MTRKDAPRERQDAGKAGDERQAKEAERKGEVEHAW